MGFSDSDESEEPSWVVEQSSADKRAAPASPGGSSSPSVAEDVQEPEAQEDSDVWSQSDEKRDEDGDEEEEEDADPEPDSSQAKEGAPKNKPKPGKAPPPSRLPFVLAPKVRRDVLLVESTDTSLDLSGDFGTIGRLRVHTGSSAGGSSSSEAGPSAEPMHGNHALTLDLKGKVFDGDVVPCNTLCLVSIDGSQAKVETVFSDIVRLGAPRSSIFDMETVAEGELGADFFDDEDDGDVNGGGDDDEEELGPLKEKGRGKASKPKRQSSKDSKGKAKGKGKDASKPKRPAPSAKAPAAKKAKA